MTRVAVLGTGPAAAQVGCEYALGAARCSGAGRTPADQRVEEALRFAASYGLAGPPDLERARSLMVRGDPTISSVERLTLIVDAQSAPLEQRASAIGGDRRRHPEALVATMALVAPTELGEAAEVGERMLATRYGDPPLLSPVVELLAARDTPRRLLDRVSQLLRALGKEPIALRREVPGLVSGRLELALLREAAWLLERGAVEAEDLDTLLRRLARAQVGARGSRRVGCDRRSRGAGGTGRATRPTRGRSHRSPRSLQRFLRSVPPPCESGAIGPRGRAARGPCRL